MRYLAVVVCAAACGRVGFGSRVAPAGDGAPSGDGTASGDDGPIADIDADPTHDEDGDGVPDLADNCPWIAGSQVDTDSDGVGDACDPDPTGANHIALFVTFADGIPAGWTTLGAATWTATADDLVAQYVDLEASVMVVPGQFTPPYTLSTAVVIDVDSPDSTNYTLSIVDTLDTATADSEKCGMVTPAGLAIGHEMAGNTVEADTQPWADAMIVGDQYTLVMRHIAGGVGCNAVDLDAPGPANNFEVDAPEYRAGPGQIGLRTRNQSVRFHYFAIVE